MATVTKEMHDVRLISHPFFVADYGSIQPGIELHTAHHDTAIVMSDLQAQDLAQSIIGVLAIKRQVRGRR